MVNLLFENLFHLSPFNCLCLHNNKFITSVSCTHPQFINVPEGLNPVNISAATFHSVVVGSRGQVYTFGCGAYFRLVLLYSIYMYIIYIIVHSGKDGYNDD